MAELTTGYLATRFRKSTLGYSMLSTIFLFGSCLVGTKSNNKILASQSNYKCAVQFKDQLDSKDINAK